MSSLADFGLATAGAVLELTYLDVLYQDKLNDSGSTAAHVGKHQGHNGMLGIANRHHGQTRRRVFGRDRRQLSGVKQSKRGSSGGTRKQKWWKHW